MNLTDIYVDFILTLFRIQVRRWMGWLLSNGDVKLDGIMFYLLFFSPISVTVEFMMSKASVLPRIMDGIIIHVVVKWDVFEL